ncbi:MAG: hypothetical protein JST66_00585 [Bacteroidetes bacterium]|nr:hypothetical protein [Bacteroidota bacterium]
MRIRITKEGGRHRLICTRRNSTWTQGDVGAGLPAHDLAHYVVESELHLTEGFFGLIDAGRGIQELGDPAVVRMLPPGALVAEVLARSLQGLSNGAIAQGDLRAAVEAELGRCPPGFTDAAVQRMLATYIGLLNAWEAVADGAALELRWR